MGYSYKSWAGVFYPAGVSTRDYLSYYSRIFNAVEVDSTFYGTPRVSTIERWSSLVPDGFVFCLKTPKIITHELSLVGAVGFMDEFVATLRSLGGKLGVILLQFPPSFHADRLPDLEAFLAGLPAGVRYAVELRHASWYTRSDQVAGALAASQVCWAATQYPRLPARIYRTTDFLYLRWIGQHGSFSVHDHERIDRVPELQRWLALIEKEIDQIDTIYGFFNNDYAGFAAATANRFKEIAGLPVEPLTPPDMPAQKRMF